MAFEKFQGFNFNHKDQRDDLRSVVTNSSEIKAMFDSRGEELAAFINALIESMNSTEEGKSAAESLGIPPLDGIDSSNVYGAMKEFNTKVDNYIQAEYKGYYEESTTYVRKDIVTYGNGIYIALQDTQGNLPTNTDYFKEILSTDTVIENVNAMGNYAKEQGDLTKEKIDYAVEQISLANTTIETVENFDYNLSSLFACYDSGIVINHNLNDYPDINCVALNRNYGQFGYGASGYGESIPYKMRSNIEYIDMNNIRVFLEEKFTETPTITKTASRTYSAYFPVEDVTITIILK